MMHFHPSALAAPLFFALATLAFTTALTARHDAHADEVCVAYVDELKLELIDPDGRDNDVAESFYFASAGLVQHNNNRYGLRLESVNGHLLYMLDLTSSETVDPNAESDFTEIRGGQE